MSVTLERVVDQHGWPRYGQRDNGGYCVHSTPPYQGCLECLALARVEDREDALTLTISDLAAALRELRTSLTASGARIVDGFTP